MQYPITDYAIVGGNIEGPFGSAFAKQWMCTATTLDVVGGEPLISVVDGKELKDFGVLTEEHRKHCDRLGPLKESIIQDFPDMIGLQVAIIKYHLQYHVPENGRFHVHVHRGKNMGSEHIAQIKKRLGFVEDDRLTFGYGYNPGELEPYPNGRPVDLYYSISLIVGFDPRYKTGTTFIPTVYTDFKSPPWYR